MGFPPASVFWGGNLTIFFLLQRAKVKPQKGQYERMARMPRNQLLDALFALFREREQWPIKLLREKTQQPEVYLKEVLSEIATLHRSGEFNGTWELMPSFKGDGVCRHVAFPAVRAHCVLRSRRKACRSCTRRSHLTRTSQWMTTTKKRRMMTTWRRSWNRTRSSHRAYLSHTSKYGLVGPSRPPAMCGPQIFYAELPQSRMVRAHTPLFTKQHIVCH